MPTPLLTISPTSTNFRYTPANNVVATKLEGGASRRRLDIVGGAHIVDCTWVLNKGEYTHLMGFFREQVLQGTTPFRMNMITDVAFVMPHVCICAQDQPRLVQQSGDAYWVETTLEVTPNPTASFAISLDTLPDYTVGVGVGTSNFNNFPVGRDVQLTGTRGLITVGGAVVPPDTLVDVDAVYEIQSKPTATSLVLVDAEIIKPDWLLILASAFTRHQPIYGACILIPE